MLVRQRAAIGPLAKCALCGVLSVTEALACEMGDCKIVNWHVPIRTREPVMTMMRCPHCGEDRLIERMGPNIWCCQVCGRSWYVEYP